MPSKGIPGDDPDTVSKLNTPNRLTDRATRNVDPIRGKQDDRFFSIGDSPQNIESRLGKFEKGGRV
jgi:hypothetical protein